MWAGLLWDLVLMALAMALNIAFLEPPLDFNIVSI
jgi:hypothetical protein